MLRTIMLVAGLMVLVPGGAIAQRPADPALQAQYGVPSLPRPVVLWYRTSLSQLQRSMMAQRTNDGGTLTAAHQARFQARLDRLNDFYHRECRNTDRFSENADGSRIDRSQVHAAEGCP